MDRAKQRIVLEVTYNTHTVIKPSDWGWERELEPLLAGVDCVVKVVDFEQPEDVDNTPA